MAKRVLVPAAMLLGLVVFLLTYIESARAPDAPVQTSGAFEALAFWSQERSYPHRRMPSGAYGAAYEQHRAQLQAQPARKAASSAWYPIGPHNLAGRTLALAFNPQNANTLFAGSASGGLWRSFSGGRGAAAWHRIPTGYPVLGVSSIAFAPGDSTVLYIGTGEVYNDQWGVGESQAARWMRGTYGLGILKSNDGGQTWAKSLDWTYQQERGVWAIQVNPRNPNTVWSATTEGIYRSFDAGTSWERVHDVSMAMAELSLLPAVRAAPEGALVVADGTSCRAQIRDGAGRDAVHAVSVLAEALARA